MSCCVHAHMASPGLTLVRAPFPFIIVLAICQLYLPSSVPLAAFAFLSDKVPGGRDGRCQPAIAQALHLWRFWPNTRQSAVKGAQLQRAMCEGYYQRALMGQRVMSANPSQFALRLA